MGAATPTIPAWSTAPTTPSSTRPKARRHRGARRRGLLEDDLGPVAAAAAARPPAPPPRPCARPTDDEPFATPWEELADAYDGLPAEDVETRRVYLRKIVEVWERGQKDIDRALDALERAFRLDIKDAEVRARAGTRRRRSTTAGIGSSAIYLGAIDEFGPIDTAVALHHDAARLRERLGQTDKAEELYDEILRLKSDDEVALARVEEISATSSAGRIWPTCSRSAPARRPRRCRWDPSAARGCASWRGCTRSAWSAPTRRSTRSNGCCSRSPRKSAATAKPATPEENAEMLGAHEALARLYSRVGLWGKVVESLQRQAELTTDRQQARALRLEVASVYEKELRGPERATEAYEAILARDRRTTRRRWPPSIA